MLILEFAKINICLKQHQASAYNLRAPQIWVAEWQTNVMSSTTSICEGPYWSDYAESIPKSIYGTLYALFHCKINCINCRPALSPPASFRLPRSWILSKLNWQLQPRITLLACKFMQVLQLFAAKQNVLLRKDTTNIYKQQVSRNHQMNSKPQKQLRCPPVS